MNTQAKDNKHTGLVLGIGLLLAGAYLLVCYMCLGLERIPPAAAEEQKENEFNNEAEFGHLMTEEINELMARIEMAEVKGDIGAALKYYQEVLDTAKDEVFGPLAGTTHTYTGVHRYCLKRLNSLGEKQKARYRLMFDGSARILLEEALEMFCFQPYRKTSLGLNIMQVAFDVESGELLYKNLFTTGAFFFRPLVAKQGVLLVKENRRFSLEDNVEVIIYSNKTGKLIADLLQIEGIGHAVTLQLIGRGREFIIKSNHKIVVVGMEEIKED